MKQLILILLLSPLFTDAQVIVTAAGGGIVLGDGGPATAAELTSPYGVALDGNGNLYICDVGAGRIRKVSPGYGGIITTIAGNGGGGYSGDGGLGIYAQLRSAIDIAVDQHGNVYIADQGNNRIRKVTPADTITTIAGTGTAGYNSDDIPATAAQLNNPSGVAVDSMGNVYIADQQNQRIRMVNTAGIIHTIAGTGMAGFSPDGSLADTAKIGILWGIRIANTGDIYYADSSRVRKINGSGIISTIAGNGIEGFSGDGSMATAAKIGGGGAIGIDAVGNLYIADGVNSRIREVILAEGTIKTIAGDGGFGYSGDGGTPLLAELNAPNGVAVDDSGDIYIGDMGNSRVRLITTHPLGVSSLNEQGRKINIFPNPCMGSFYIIISSNTDEQTPVIITNIFGEKIKEFSTATNRQIKIELDYPPGIYYLSAKTTQNVFYQKIVIQ